MRLSVYLRTIGTVALVAAIACGKRPAVRVPAGMPYECAILRGPEESADTLIVSLPGRVRPGNAPLPRNAGEELLFGHMYETLATVDCRDEVREGLAESWESGGGGRCWTFRLRADARFWDGTPVTASDVAWSWRYAAVEPAMSGAGIDSVTVSGNRVLHVHFRYPHRDAPRSLSAPGFAVVKPTWDSEWPLGSGPYTITGSGRAETVGAGQILILEPAFGAGGPVLRFMWMYEHDARDLLEGVIDVMITSDPAVIEYASETPGLVTLALPWDITYVFLSPSSVEAIRDGGGPCVIPSDLSEGLARDAVRCDARGYRHPNWWTDIHGCEGLFDAIPWVPSNPRGAEISRGPKRVLYDTVDPVARDLAERIVALAAADPEHYTDAEAFDSALHGILRDGAGTVAEGVSNRDLDRRLRYGYDFAYVIPVTSRPYDPCHEARDLVSRARWLANLGIDFPKAVVPLVETRRHVIADSSKAGLIADWYGGIFIVSGKPEEVWSR